MPNQNNNEEWYLIGKSLHNYFKTAKVVRVNDVLTAIKDNVDYLISQAEQRGYERGYQEGYDRD